jgi:hypothetical protein
MRLRVECFPTLISLTIRVRQLVPIIVWGRADVQTAPFSAEIHQKVASTSRQS